MSLGEIPCTLLNNRLKLGTALEYSLLNCVQFFDTGENLALYRRILAGTCGSDFGYRMQRRDFHRHIQTSFPAAFASSSAH